MGIFSNLTQLYFNNSLCNGTAYYHKETLEECFLDPRVCCDRFTSKGTVYGECINGKINYCESLNQPLEQLGYIVQIFGILSLTITGTLIVFGVVKFFCTKQQKNNEYEQIL